MNISIVTNDILPNLSTFINAQREMVKDVKYFFYGGLIPTHEYKLGFLGKLSLNERIVNRLVKGDYKKKVFVKFLKKHKVDLLLVQYGVCAAALVDICKDNNIKLIPHFHGYDAYEYSIINAYMNEYKKVFEYSSSIIAVSKAMKNQLIKLGASRDKIIVNPCAPNDDFYDVKPNYQSNKLITIGRFVDKKAPYLTVLAFAEAKKVLPELELVMIGEGPLLNTVKNLRNYFGLENSIHLRGLLNRKKIVEAMADSFCYVQHSIVALNGDSEGTPVAIMEAGAAALPVISTRHAGIPDVTIENKTAFLLDEHDVEGMANSIIKLASNRKLAKRMGDAGRIYTKQNMSMKKYIEKIDQCISKAVLLD